MTTTFPPDAQAAPAATLAAAGEAVRDLKDVMWAAKSPEELLAANAEIERLRSVLAGIQAQVCVEVESTAAAKQDGWASTKDYLTSVSGGRHGTGGRIMRTARGLTGDRGLTQAALLAGDLSPEHAEVIVRVVDHLPVDRDVRDRAERFLIDRARVLNASELAKAGDYILEVVDPEGAAKKDEKKLEKQERSAHLNRFLTIVEDGLGGARIKGRGTVEDAAVIKAALASLSAPSPAGSFADSDPDCGLDGKDTRDHGARTWDALVEACQRLQDAQVLPESHGQKPRVVVTIDFENLRDQVGVGTLDTGESLSAAAVRRLACDCEVLPAMLSRASAVLDTAAGQRFITALLWIALTTRDRHCAFPGCRRQPIACDAHHIVHWVDGGPTTLDNLVLLCRAHHQLIHHSGWQVRLNPHDLMPEFKPPPGRHRLDPGYRDSLQPTGPPGENDGWIRERVSRA